MRASAGMVLLLLLAGCASTGTTNLANRTVSAQEVQEIVRANQDRMHSLKGEGRISVENPSIAQSASFALVLRKPDSILLNIEGPFGLKVGAALLTRQEFLFYNSLQNQLVSGSTNAANLSRILRINIAFDDVFNLFTGGIFLPDDMRAPDETRVEDDQFVLLYRLTSGTRQYWIDPVSLMIRKIQSLDASGKLTLEQTFSDFQTVDGVTVPFRIRVLQPRERQRVALSYSDIAVNANPLQFPFSYPDNAQRVRW
ncbi:MAG: DUF4292 domain-containing protein [Bacteroidota bacterium]